MQESLVAFVRNIQYAIPVVTLIDVAVEDTQFNPNLIINLAEPLSRDLLSQHG